MTINFDELDEQNAEPPDGKMTLYLNVPMVVALKYHSNREDRSCMGWPHLKQKMHGGRYWGCTNPTDMLYHLYNHQLAGDEIDPRQLRSAVRKLEAEIEAQKHTPVDHR